MLNHLGAALAVVTRSGPLNPTYGNGNRACTTFSFQMVTYVVIPVGKERRRFMRYEWEGNIFEQKALPFGMAEAPYVSTRMLQPLLQKWRKELDIAIIAWLDDIIMGHMSKSQQIMNDLSE